VPGQYSERDLDVLLMVAKHIAIALENALLFEEISKEKKEWERTFDAITDMVWIEDGKQQSSARTRPCCHNGFTKAEITGNTAASSWTGSASTSHAVSARHLAGKRPSFQELKNAAATSSISGPTRSSTMRVSSMPLSLPQGRDRAEAAGAAADPVGQTGVARHARAGIAHEINNRWDHRGVFRSASGRAHDPSLADVRGFEDFPNISAPSTANLPLQGHPEEPARVFAPVGRTFREIDVNELIKEVLLLLQHRTSRCSTPVARPESRPSEGLRGCGQPPPAPDEPAPERIYFTPAGGIISISTGPDRLSGAEGVRLTVSDTARDPGGPHRQGLRSLLHDQAGRRGTGLGLTICHRIVEEHGGTVDVESEPGRGTTFIIKLPAIKHG